MPLSSKSCLTSHACALDKLRREAAKEKIKRQAAIFGPETLQGVLLGFAACLFGVRRQVLIAIIEGGNAIGFGDNPCDMRIAFLCAFAPSREK
jgi:hypothetical protein